jgi:hypothetical protein
MSLANAFESLQKAKAIAVGNREFVLLNGRKIEAMVSEISADEMIISGGLAEQGGFRVQIAQSAVAEQPRKGDEIECRGQALVVMSSNDVNGVTYDLTAGDPASEDR